jgi:hypothetical protein
MVCIGNGMHWQWFAKAMAMVCIALPLYGMHWQWYAFPCHCMVCIGNGMVWYAFNLLILVKCFVDDIVTSGHQPRIVALNYSLVAQEKRSKEKNLRINGNEWARKQLHS